MTTTLPERDVFARAWADWHRQHEARLADPHGFLTVTALHWLTGTAQRFDGVPGAWSTGPDGVEVVLDRVGPVVVGAGFSGHGFKSAPAVGRVLADLALGQPGVPALALATHADHTAVTV